MGCGSPSDCCTDPASINEPALGKDSDRLDFPFSVGS